MKPIFITLAFALSTSVSFASEIKTYDSEALELANTLILPTVKRCLSEIENQNGANLTIVSVAKHEAENKEQVLRIQGMLLNGGMLQGSIEIVMTGTFTPMIGQYVYKCTTQPL
jgi:hypothetical protein